MSEWVLRKNGLDDKLDMNEESDREIFFSDLRRKKKIKWCKTNRNKTCIQNTFYITYVHCAYSLRWFLISNFKVAHYEYTYLEFPLCLNSLLSSKLQWYLFIKNIQSLSEGFKFYFKENISEKSKSMTPFTLKPQKKNGVNKYYFVVSQQAMLFFVLNKSNC